jgi:hypothetical protein
VSDLWPDVAGAERCGECGILSGGDYLTKELIDGLCPPCAWWHARKAEGRAVSPRRAGAGAVANVSATPGNSPSAEPPPRTSAPLT